MEPKRVLLGTKRGSSKGYPVGIAEEPFLVLGSTFFSESVTNATFKQREKQVILFLTKYIQATHDYTLILSCLDAAEQISFFTINREM